MKEDGPNGGDWIYNRQWLGGENGDPGLSNSGSEPWNCVTLILPVRCRELDEVLSLIQPTGKDGLSGR